MRKERSNNRDGEEKYEKRVRKKRKKRFFNWVFHFQSTELILPALHSPRCSPTTEHHFRYPSLKTDEIPQNENVTKTPLLFRLSPFPIMTNLANKINIIFRQLSYLIQYILKFNNFRTIWSRPISSQTNFHNS